MCVCVCVCVSVCVCKRYIYSHNFPTYTCTSEIKTCDLEQLVQKQYTY